MAVSGGVDSMVLLDVVRRLPDVTLVVVHVNHGIREDAIEDAKLVGRMAMSHNLPYESIDLHLGAGASEEEARRQRYAFLRRVCKKYNARAILTAHHRDDILETAIINMLRGTGWRGLSSLRSTPQVIRPFLSTSKHDLIAYAKKHHLEWRHDSTNDDQRYLRNYVRHQILAQVPPMLLEKIHAYIVRQNKLTDDIDSEVANWLATHVQFDSPATARLPRYQFIMTPHDVAHELLQSVLRRVGGKSVPRPLLRNALLFIHVAKASRVFQLDSQWQLRALPREVIVERRPTVVSLDNDRGLN